MGTGADMGLCVEETSREWPATCAALRDAVARRGGATLWVASLSQALDAQRGLAAAGVALGVTVTTPEAWAQERWGVWGDGRRVVTGQERVCALRLALDAARDELLATSPGTLDALAPVAREALAWLPLDDGGRVDGADPRTRALTPGERAALGALGRYARLIADAGLVELCEAMALLPDLVAAPLPLVVAGTSPLSLAARELACGLAAHTDVLVVSAHAEGPGGGLARARLARLQASAAARGVAARRTADGAAAEPGPTAAAELVALRDRLFRAPDGREPLVAGGALRLLEPSGSLSEWELVARELRALADRGADDVVVAVADVERAWRGLAPKLAARGLTAQGARRRAAADEPAVRAFMGFARTVAELAELAQTWPGPTDGLDGRVPRLGDMSWWPPRALSDFLLCDVASVDAARAHALDARWRSNRSLTPGAVLEQLQRESLGSRPVAQATAALVRGRVDAAAQALARAPGRDAPTVAALACVADAARCVTALGAGLAGTGAARRAGLSLTRLVELVGEVLAHGSLPSHERLAPVGAAASGCRVRICSREEAAGLAPRSADALVACNLTADEWPLSPADDAASALLDHLGLAVRDDELARARAQLLALVGVPRDALLLERRLHDADAAVAYPAAMYAEALACYGLRPGAVPAGSPLAPATLGELGASANLSAAGTPPAPMGSDPSSPAGVVGPAAAGMVVVPREGQDALPDGRPSLSASQIESYLECPYKWFALRRLGLSASDASFSAVQMGSFAHRVLELARTGLARRAAERAGLVAPGEPFDLESLDAPLIPGAAVGQDNLEAARELVSTEFDRHLEHQRASATTLASQSLVPHTATQRWRLSLLRQDLLSTLDFEAGRLRGFEPRHLELRFGSARKDALHVSYAGADFLGSVDRVDVDAHGRAVVIDYKHKARAGFSAEYDAFAREAPAGADGLVLPRRVQALIYAQVVRRLYPQLKLVGAVYLSTMGAGPADHEIAGALDAGAVEQVMGGDPSPARAARLVVGAPGRISFHELLDECERRVAAAIRRMVAGDIVANPAGPHACAWCPVANCERRLG